MAALLLVLGALTADTLDRVADTAAWCCTLFLWVQSTLLCSTSLACRLLHLHCVASSWRGWCHMLALCMQAQPARLHSCLLVLAACAELQYSSRLAAFGLCLDAEAEHSTPLVMLIMLCTIGTAIQCWLVDSMYSWSGGCKQVW